MKLEDIKSKTHVAGLEPGLGFDDKTVLLVTLKFKTAEFETE